jgi:hypothetical protein
MTLIRVPKTTGMTAPETHPETQPVRIGKRAGKMTGKRARITVVKRAGITSPVRTGIFTGKTAAKVIPGTVWGPLGGGVGLTFWSAVQVSQ